MEFLFFLFFLFFVVLVGIVRVVEVLVVVERLVIVRPALFFGKFVERDLFEVFFGAVGVIDVVDVLVVIGIVGILLCSIRANLFARFEIVDVADRAQFFLFVFEEAGAADLQFRLADIAIFLFFGDPVEFATGASLILCHNSYLFSYAETRRSLRVVLYAFARHL